MAALFLIMQDPLFSVPPSPSRHVWSDSHMSHHPPPSHSEHSRSPRHRAREEHVTAGLQYEAERDAHKDERQLATCSHLAFEDFWQESVHSKGSVAADWLVLDVT